MDSYRAVSILDGFANPPCTSAAEYIEACRFIRDKGPRGILCGNGTRDAIAIADAADADYDDVLDRLQNGEV